MAIQALEVGIDGSSTKLRTDRKHLSDDVKKVVTLAEHRALSRNGLDPSKGEYTHPDVHEKMYGFRGSEDGSPKRSGIYDDLAVPAGETMDTPEGDDTESTGKSVYDELAVPA